MCGNLPFAGSEMNMYALRHTANHTTTTLRSSEENFFMEFVVVHVMTIPYKCSRLF